MPPIIRLYITHVLIGFGLSAVFVAALLWWNVVNLWHLVSTSDVGLLAVLLLWIFNGIVFAGVQFGIAVMRLADGPETGGGTRGPRVSQPPRPVRVTVPASKDRTSGNRQAFTG